MKIKQKKLIEVTEGDDFYIVEYEDGTVKVNDVPMSRTFEQAIEEVYATMQRMDISERERSKDLHAAHPAHVDQAQDEPALERSGVLPCPNCKSFYTWMRPLVGQYHDRFCCYECGYILEVPKDKAIEILKAWQPKEIE